MPLQLPRSSSTPLARRRPSLRAPRIAAALALAALLAVGLQSAAAAAPSFGAKTDFAAGNAPFSVAAAADEAPATLSLTLGAPVSFGAFTPGVARNYEAGTTALVTSTAGDATLTVHDASSSATGRLVNGTFSLPQALQARATSPAGTGTAYSNVGGTASPLPLLTYSAPVSNDSVTLQFRQSIGANDGLRTGTYAKTLTFTLSSTDGPCSLSLTLVAGRGPASETASCDSPPDTVIAETTPAAEATTSVAGAVPATLSLTLGAPASFGAFTPCVRNTYLAGATANVISTAGDALLAVHDASSIATGHLVNGAFSLPQPLQARARNAANTGTAFNNVGSTASPLNLLAYFGPVSNDPVSLQFSQLINADDALQSGTYAKQLTFTLSSTDPPGSAVSVTLVTGSGPSSGTASCAPAAVNDGYTTAEDTPLTVATPGVLGNDTDAQNDPLTATLVSGPAHAASFTFNANGSFSYTPAANFNGSDSFSYKAGDGALDSNTATVTITVNAVNDAPTVQVAAGGSCINERSGRINLTVADIDSPAASLTLSGTSGNQTLVRNGDLAFAGAGSNRTLTATSVSGRTGTAAITVTVSDGSLAGTALVTALVGGGNDQTLTGTAGADIVFGQNGNDTLNGLGGNDLLCGDNGDDRLDGGDGDDTLDGGDGNDGLTGGAGADLVDGKNGNDTLNGLGGNDVLRGGDGNDTSDGGEGDDTLEGGTGNDVMIGLGGNDVLRGGDGNDVLGGGQGDDTLDGGLSNDRLTGGAGADRFSGGSGSDVNTDFNAGQGDTTDGT